MQKVTVRDIVIGTSILLAGIISAMVYMFASIAALTYIVRRIGRLPFVLSFVIAVFIYALLGSLIIHLVYMTNFAVNYQVLHAVLYLLIMMLFVGVRLTISSRDGLHILWAQEGIFLLTLLIPFLFFTLPYFGASSAKTMELMETAEDTSSQFQMYHYVLGEGEVVYKDTGEQKMIRASLTNYPQGSHAAAATVTSGFVAPTEISLHATLASFMYSMAFLYSSIFVLALAIIHLIVNKGKQQDEYESQTSALLALSAAVLLGLGALNLFINWVTYGFYGQIFAYAALLLTLLVTVMILQSSNDEFKRKAQGYPFLGLLSYVALVALGFFGVYSSWYLLAPIAALSLLAVCISNFGALLQNYKQFIAVLLLPVIVCIYLTYVYLFTSDSSGHILTSGAVVQIAWPFLVLASLSVIGILIYSLKNKMWDQALLAGMAVVASIFVGLVGVYQQLKIDHLEYYFYKTTFTALLLILISCLAFIAFMLRDAKMGRRSSVNLLVYLSIVTVLLFGIIGARYTKDDPWYYYSTQYGVVQLQKSTDFNVLLNQSIYKKYSDMIFVGNCDMHQNFLGTIWAGSMFLQYGQSRGSLEWEVLQKEGREIVTDITEYAKNRTKPVAVYVSGDCSGQYTTLQAENVDFLRK